jgi:hypothetical protein
MVMRVWLKETILKEGGNTADCGHKRVNRDLGIMDANKRLRDHKSSAREDPDREVLSARAFWCRFDKSTRVQRILCVE